MKASFSRVVSAERTCMPLLVMALQSDMLKCRKVGILAKLARACNQLAPVSHVCCGSAPSCKATMEADSSPSL